MTTKHAVRREVDEVSSSDGKQGHFDHPVFKKLSVKNGEINRMTKEQLKMKLEKLNLDTRGVKEVVKKRLKSYYKRRKLAAAHIHQSKSGPQYDYYLVIDFEATCQEHNPDQFKHEIIEFPIVLIDSEKKEAIDEFHAYVKPFLNPVLSPFCTELTGISQMMVDRSETFPSVLAQVEEWLKQHNLHRKGSCGVITDGPWDMSRFMFTQCQLSRVHFPRWARKWVNIRKAYCNFYQFRKAKLASMLENLGMCFEGHQHSGIDDARNISRVAIRMLEDGNEMRVNERLHEERLRLIQELANEADQPGAACAGECLVQGDVLPVAGGDLNSDIENDCESETDSGELEVGVTRSDIAALEAGVNRMHVAQPQSRNSCSSDEGETENVDDLLAYYALQNT